MEALGIKKHETFIRYFTDLIDWGFIKMIQKSSNQYTANIISLENAVPKNGKALEKALEKATRNHAEKQTVGTGESNRSIDKLQTNTGTIEPQTSNKAEIFYGSLHSLISEWFQYKKERKESYKSENSKLAFQKKLEELSGQNFEKAKAIIQQSMANNWAGIFELKNNIQQVQSGSDALREELNKRNNFRKSQAQQNLEDFQSMRAAIQFDLEHPPLTEIGDGTNA